jgi:hypothetical protein
MSDHYPISASLAVLQCGYVRRHQQAGRARIPFNTQHPQPCQDALQQQGRIQRLQQAGNDVAAGHITGDAFLDAMGNVLRDCKAEADQQWTADGTAAISQDTYWTPELAALQQAARDAKDSALAAHQYNAPAQLRDELHRLAIRRKKELHAAVRAARKQHECHAVARMADLAIKNPESFYKLCRPACYVVCRYGP